MLFLELCSGTGEISKIASNILGCHYTTVDIDESRNPHIIADLTDWNEKNAIELSKIIERNDVFVWGSPDCSEYSRMKTTGVRNFGKADMLVESMFKIANGIKAIGIIMENPATGLLKERPVMEEYAYMVPNVYTVNYCQYGSPVAKKTNLWSSVDLEKYGFQALTCNKETCKSAYFNEETKRWNHILEYDDYTNYDRRISVPSQLVADIFKAVKLFCKEKHPTALTLTYPKVEIIENTTSPSPSKRKEIIGVHEVRKRRKENVYSLRVEYKGCDTHHHISLPPTLDECKSLLNNTPFVDDRVWKWMERFACKYHEVIQNSGSGDSDE